MQHRIYKAKSLEKFTKVSNEVLKSPELSMQAKGLFCYLQSLPDDWIIHKTELQNHFTNGRESINNAFNELVNFGLIEEVQQLRGEDGKFKNTDFIVYPDLKEKELIKENPLQDNRDGKTVDGLPLTENQLLLNTDKTNKENKEKKNKNYLMCELDNSHDTSDYFQIALAFYKTFVNNAKKLNVKWTHLGKTKLQNCITPIRELIDDDNRTKEELYLVMNFISKDSFWMQQIQSTKNLQDKFDRLITYATNQKTQPQKKLEKFKKL